MDKKNILLLTTGGTIASVPGGQGLEPHRSGVMERELEQEASDRSEEAQRKSPELSEESWRELEEALRSMHMEETDKAGEGE